MPVLGKKVPARRAKNDVWAPLRNKGKWEETTERMND